MSGSAHAVPRVATVGRQRLPAVLRTPPQGWSSLLLLCLMLLVTGLAVDDVRWVPPGADGRSQTGFLPVLMVAAGLVGFVVARSSLALGRLHLVAAAVGSGLLLVAVAGAVSDAPELLARLRELSTAVAEQVGDVIVAGQSTETAAFLLALGAICWAAGQFAAVSIFRRSRALPAVACAGAILFVHLSLAVTVRWEHLVAFALAALLLFIRLNLTQQRLAWGRRHIADGGEVTRLFLRTGFLFVALAVGGAAALAAALSAAPLAEAWQGVGGFLASIGLQPPGGGVSPGQARPPSGLFGASQTITGVWQQGAGVAFLADASDDGPHYWRGAIYDELVERTWYSSRRTSQLVPAGGDLLAGTQDSLAGLAGARRQVDATISLVGLGGRTLLTPEGPETVDRESDVLTNEAGGPLVGIEARGDLEAGAAYAVTAQVAAIGDELGGLTATRLAAAGVDYPVFVDRYLEVVPDSVGRRTQSRARELVDALPAGQRDPYHVALAVQGHLRDTAVYTYDTDVTGVCGGDEPIPDCLLRARRGYCQHFATTMVMMLRTSDIPARYVQGYLPGRRLPGGTFEVEHRAAHAWVEVYFPDYGWVRFDPTPSLEDMGQEATDLPQGEPLPSPSFPPDGPAPGASPSPRPEPSIPPPDAGGVPPSGRDEGPLVVIGPILLGALLVLAVVGLLLFRLRRLPRPEGDAAYRGVASLASRLGHRPAPTQTVYEYIGSLAEVMPDIADDLQLVADARVESVYARRATEGTALEALRRAYGRTRMRLLRLFLRRSRPA